MATDDRHHIGPEITLGAFPIVAAFLRGYLHQDWMMDYESAQHARDVFLDDASADERTEFAREALHLERLLAAMPLRDVTLVLTERLGGQWLPESLDEVHSVFALRAADDVVDL